MKKKSQQTKYVRGTNTAGTNPSFLCPDRKEYTYDNAVTSPDVPEKNIQTSVWATDILSERARQRDIHLFDDFLKIHFEFQTVEIQLSV